MHHVQFMIYTLRALYTYVLRRLITLSSLRGQDCTQVSKAEDEFLGILDANLHHLLRNDANVVVVRRRR